MGVVLDLLGFTLTTIVIALLLIFVISPFLTVSRFLKVQLWTPRKTPCLRSLSGELEVLLDIARPELEQAGFQYMYSWKIRAIHASEDIPPSYCDVYHHLDQQVIAEVYPCMLAQEQRLYTIHLWNVYIDGSALQTMNGPQVSVLPFSSRITVIDSNNSDLAGQLAIHLLAREKITVLRTELNDAQRILQSLAESYLEQLAKDGKVSLRSQRGDDEIYSLQFWNTLKSAWRFHLTRLSKIGKKAVAAQPAQSTIRTQVSDADLQTARQVRDRQAFILRLYDLPSMQITGLQNTIFRFWLMAIFVAVAVDLYGLKGALVMGIVLAVQEVSRFLMLKLCGLHRASVQHYPNKVGVKQVENAPFKLALVYMAGPITGVLLAFSILAILTTYPGLNIYTTSPYLNLFILAAVLVSSVKLLPLLPFDGGSLLNLLLTGRMPYLRFVFVFASTLLVFFLASEMNTGRGYATAIATVLLIISCYQFKISSITARLLKLGIDSLLENTNLTTAVGRLYDFLEQSQFPRLSFNYKLIVAQTILPRYLFSVPRSIEVIKGIGIYLASIALSLALLFAAVTFAPYAILHIVEESTYFKVLSNVRGTHTSKDSIASREAEKLNSRQERAAQITAAQGDQRAKILRDALSEAAEDDPEDALRIARMYYTENSAPSQITYEHADAAQSMAHALRYWSGKVSPEEKKKLKADITKYLQEAETILLTRLHGHYERDDAHLLSIMLAARERDPDSPLELPVKQVLVTLLSKDKQEEDFELLHAHELLARGYYRSGMIDKAIQELQNAQTDDGCVTKARENYNCQSLNMGQAWILLEQKKFDEADKLVTPYLELKVPSFLRVLPQAKDGYELKWMAAMMQKNAPAAYKEAIALYRLETPSTDNWLTDYLYRYTGVAGNLSTKLMLIDSLRAIGEQNRADQIALSLNTGRHQAHAKFSDNKPLECQIELFGNPWEIPFQQSLLLIEQRETKCTAKTNANW